MLVRVIFVQPDGARQDIDGPLGRSVMQVATDSLVPGIVGECGGELICATCHVFLDPAWSSAVPPKSSTEEDTLELTSEVPTENSRLSCQLVLTKSMDGVVVVIPRSQR